LKEVPFLTNRICFYKNKVMSYVINPRTKRPIKVGGRTWIKLVKGDPQIEKILGNEGEFIDEMSLPENIQAVKGRGKYKGKIVTRNMKPPVKDIINHVIKTAANAMGSKEWESIIMQELLSENPEYEIKENLSLY